MAAETFSIEIPIKVEDQTEPGVGSATKKVNGFDKANQKTQERLEKMNRTKYQVVLSVLDKASSVVGAISSKVRGFAGKTFSFTMKVLDAATAPLRGIWNFATSIQGAILGATGTFAGFIQPMNLAGDFEQTKIAFDTMLGSAEKSSKFLQEASDFANKTPFEFPELVNSSKLLKAFGFEIEKVIPMMTTIGDTSSGLGAGSEGIDRITRSLGQMQAKGRVQTEELLQLQELGVPAAQILQEELGMTAEQVANIGREGVSSGKAIDALLRGMDKRFGGMMDNQSKTAKGMISTIKDTLQNNLLRNWGEGLWAGFKPGLEKITTWIDENQDTIKAWSAAWKDAGASISKWVMSKVDSLRKKISAMVKSPEWKDAQTFGQKAKVAWDKIIAEPFSEWWNSTGKAWFVEKAASIGKGIGSGISTGLLAILGIDVSGAKEDGKSAGSAFINGFKEGFDLKKVGDALKEWVDNNKALAVGLGAILGAKFIAGIIKVVSKGKNLFNSVKNIFGGGKGSNSTTPGTSSPVMPSSYTTSTMRVTAGVVNVYGSKINDLPNTKNIPDIYNIPKLPSGGSRPRLPRGSTTLALPAAKSVAKRLLTSGASSADDIAGVASKTGILSRIAGLFGKGASSADDIAKVASGAGKLGKISGFLGKGSKGIPIIGTALAAIGGAVEIAAAPEEQKGRTAAGVGGGLAGGLGGAAAGAAAGGALGTVVPGIGNAIGAGVGGIVGGIGGAIGGEAFTEWIYDSKDAIGNFFTKTLPDKWNEFWGGVGDFFSETIPEWWGDLCDTVGTFFTETIPEKWDEFWTGIGDFFTQDIPYAIGYAVGKIETFFTETLPEKWGEFWGGIGDFFTQTIPEWWGNLCESLGNFFTVTIPEKWNEFWGAIGNFFTETLPEWWGNLCNSLGTFFTVTIPEKWGEFWNAISTFFTETIPVWASGIWNNNIVPFFTETIPGFFGSIWDSVTGFFTEQLPAIAGNIWSTVSGWFSAITDWFSSIWDNIKGAFGAGREDGKNGSGYGASKKDGTEGPSLPGWAWGGILSKPHMGIVAEDGPESIIPLNPSKRARGIDLWQQTGESLGVRPYADGGIVGDEPAFAPVPVNANNGGGQGVNIKVEVKSEPKFTIEGGNNADETKIIAILKAYIREMADDIGDELAERLARIFANMPVKGGV